MKQRSLPKISARQLVILGLAAVALRLLFTGWQRMTLLPESTLLDDALMYNGAVNIVNGQWLGPYTYLTLGKHMLFSLWLALVHVTGISYLLAGHLLSIFGCFVAVAALAPIVRNNTVKLLVFTALIFCPALYADYTLRVYRDNITISFFLLVFACVIGLALRWNREKTASFWVFSVGGGFALGASYLLREDGYWLLPFAVLGCGIALFCVLRNRAPKRVQKTGAVVTLFAVAALCVLAYCGMNYRYYGRFIVSDFTSADFQAAYGALTRIERSEDDNIIVPVDAALREQLYAASPAFAELRPYLEEGETLGLWRKDVGDGTLDYSGGGFYWAVRNAVSLAGYYEDAATAQAYYERLAAELNAAYDAGLLPAAAGRRSALNTPLTGRYVGPTMAEVGRSLFWVTTYRDMDCSPALSTGPLYLMEEMEAFLHCKSMRTVRTPAPDTRVVVWALHGEERVQVEVVRSDGSALNIDRTPGTGADVYMQRLQEGVTEFAPEFCRTTATFLTTDELLMLRLSAGESMILVPLREMESSITQNGITYRIEYVDADYTEEVVFGTAELWLYRGMRIVVWIYRIVSPLVLLLALYCCLASLLRARGHKPAAPNTTAVLAWLITLGVGLSILLRVGMVSFAETSAFGIGTNPMYLAALYPLLILFCALCFVCYARPFQPQKEKGEGHAAVR